MSSRRKKLGKISVAKAERGELLWFCHTIKHGRLDGVAMIFNGRSISQLTPCLRPARKVLLGPSYRCPIHRTICHHARRLVHPRVSSAVPRIGHRRSAKTQATVKLKDLPQGVVKLDSYDDGVDDAPRYPTVVQGHRNNMQKFKNCVVLTRVGGFYEVQILAACQERAPTDDID